MNIFRILERHLAINHDMYSFNSPLRTSILALVGVSVLWKDSDKFVSFLLGILLTDFVDPGGSLGMKLKFTGLSGITTVLGATLAATALPLFPSRPIEYSRVCSSQIWMLSETWSYRYQAFPVSPHPQFGTAIFSSPFFYKNGPKVKKSILPHSFFIATFFLIKLMCRRIILPCSPTEYY